MTIQQNIKIFIENNRQSGNTTIAMESAIKHDAYFVVADQMQKIK